MSLSVRLLGFLSLLVLPAAGQSPATWAEVETLFAQRKFGAVLKQIGPFIPQDQDSPHYLPRYYRGAALVEGLWQARTGVPLGSDQPVEARRDSFEIVFPPQFASQLESALNDLAIAGRGLNFQTALAGADRDHTLEENIARYQATAATELATYSAQTHEAFARVTSALAALRAARAVPLALYGKSADEWKLPPTQLAAELRALVARGDFQTALACFARWQRSDDSSLRPESALPALVSACDLTGNYARARGYLLAFAGAQLNADPAAAQNGRLAPCRAALRAHLQNLRLAYGVDPAGIRLPLQLARYAGAVHLHDATNPKARQTVQNAVLRLRDEFGEPPPLDLELFALLGAVQQGTETEIVTARTHLTRRLAGDPDNAGLRAVRGFDAYLRDDFAQAEADLVYATERDPCWVLSLNAFECLAQVYEKTGRSDRARQTNEAYLQLRHLLAALAET